MKILKRINLVAVFALGIYCAGCGGNSNSEDMSGMQPDKLQALAESLEIWKEEKKQNGASYKYSVTFVSWIGYDWKMTIVVEQDEFAERNYIKHTYNDQTGQIEQISQWNEITPEELGVHNDGAPLKLIEELYDECREDVLTKNEKDYDIYLGFYENGILAHCYYRPKGCDDDCYAGVWIEDFEFL